MPSMGTVAGFLQGFTQTFQQMQEHGLRKKRAAVDELEAGNRTKLLDAQIKRMGEESAHQKQLEKNAQNQMALQEQNIQFRRDEAKASLIQTQMSSFPIPELRDEGQQAQFDALQGELDAVFTQPSPGDFSGGGAGVVEGLGQAPASQAGGGTDFNFLQPNFAPRGDAPATTSSEPQQPAAQPAQKEAIPILPEETEELSMRLKAVNALVSNGHNVATTGSGEQVLVVQSQAAVTALMQNPRTKALIDASALSVVTQDQLNKTNAGNNDVVVQNMMQAVQNTSGAFMTAANNAAARHGLEVSNESSAEFFESGGKTGTAHPIAIEADENGVSRFKMGDTRTPESISVIADVINTIDQESLGFAESKGLLDAFELQASTPIRLGMMAQPESFKQVSAREYRFNRFGPVSEGDFFTVNFMLNQSNQNASGVVKQVPPGKFRFPTDAESARDFEDAYTKSSRSIPRATVRPTGSRDALRRPSEDDVGRSVQERADVLAKALASTDAYDEFKITKEGVGGPQAIPEDARKIFSDALELNLPLIDLKLENLYDIPQHKRSKDERKEIADLLVLRSGVDGGSTKGLTRKKQFTDNYTLNYIGGPVNPDLRELMSELRKRVGLSYSLTPREKPRRFVGPQIPARSR